jgi:hypothetical protein
MRSVLGTLQCNLLLLVEGEFLHFKSSSLFDLVIKAPAQYVSLRSMLPEVHLARGLSAHLQAYDKKRKDVEPTHSSLIDHAFTFCVSPQSPPTLSIVSSKSMDPRAVSEDQLRPFFVPSDQLLITSEPPPPQLISLSIGSDTSLRVKGACLVTYKESEEAFQSVVGVAAFSKCDLSIGKVREVLLSAWTSLEESVKRHQDVSLLPLFQEQRMFSPATEKERLVRILCRALSPYNIALVLSLVMAERKVLLVSSKYSLVTEVRLVSIKNSTRHLTHLCIVCREHFYAPQSS